MMMMMMTMMMIQDDWLLPCNHVVFSQLVTPFQVDFVEPFIIEPQDGTLQPYSSLKLKASFQPKVYSLSLHVKIQFTPKWELTENQIKSNQIY